MKISDYKFEIGDEVITVEGVKGKIVDICHCSACESRGFPEPVWVKDDDKSETRYYIAITNARIGFLDFYKIGKYRFNDFEKGEVLREMAYHEDMLKKLRQQLRVIEAVELEDKGE